MHTNGPIIISVTTIIAAKGKMKDKFKDFKDESTPCIS